jgi:hypothetical protein
MNLFALTPVGSKVCKAEAIIRDVFPNLLSRVTYEVKDYLPENAYELAGNNNTPDGAYENGIVYLHKNSEQRSVLHEIGHAVHYQLCGAKDVCLPKSLNNDRSNINPREDFAEAFADFFLEIENGNRNEIMGSLLSSL